MPEDRKRQTLIVDALVDAFADLMDHDASAFRGKFRSMAADPWAFYRGSACVFSADMAETEDRWSDERTARIWIQGDLHAENFGTYMDGKGVLVFDVKDLDEAYLGSFTWDLRSFVDSDRDHDWALRLDTATGAVRTALQKAQLSTRVERAYAGDLDTIPESKRLGSISYTLKDVVAASGFGIGSAGLPAYNLLVEGHTQALENDVVLSMKQGNVAAPSRVVEAREAREFFHHHGHRTAVSQSAPQAHADPWLGWTELDGTGFVVAEISPYDSDLDWSALSEPEDLTPVMDQLGRATAKVHCVSDKDSGDTPLVDFQTEDAVAEAIGDDVDGFVSDLVGFAHAYAERARADHALFVSAFRSDRIPQVSATG